MSRHHGPGPLRKATCPVCGRSVSVYVPTTSTTGREVFRAHRLKSSTQYCDGYARQVEDDEQCCSHRSDRRCDGETDCDPERRCDPDYAHDRDRSE